jgi:hypothetical protein
MGKGVLHCFTVCCFAVTCDFQERNPSFKSGFAVTKGILNMKQEHSKYGRCLLPLCSEFIFSLPAEISNKIVIAKWIYTVMKLSPPV